MDQNLLEKGLNQPIKSLENQNSNGFMIQFSKINKSTLRDEFVKRQALIESLEANVILPLTLISAATGYGKSVLTSQWLDETNHPYGWLSLDEEHNDFEVFIKYLVWILKENWPLKTFQAELLLQGFNSPASLIASIFMNDLEQLENRLVLVLDDYHLIQEEKIHQFISEILSHPSKNLHLVILTQRDPPIRLARLRAHLKMNEIRMDDLVFSFQESQILRTTISAHTTDEQVKILVEKADGWITGISAGLLGLARGITIEKVVNALNSGGSVISELLNEVVFQGMSIKTQKFIGLTAILSSFSEELVCKMVKVLNDPDFSVDEVNPLIRQSREQNLFLIPLGPEGKWFRYHHLFRSQIRRLTEDHFNEELIQELYKEASLYSNEHVSLEEALKYAILSKDMFFAISILEKHRISLHNSEQIQRLERLIKMFSKDVIMCNPELLLSLAILQDHRANFQAMKKYLDQAENILFSNNFDKPTLNELKGQFHCVCCFLPFFQGDYQTSLYHAEKGLSLLPANEPNYFREYALAYFALAHQATGKTSIGLKEVYKTFEGPLKNDNYFRGRLLYIKILIHSRSGNAKELMKLGVQLQAIHLPQNHPSAWMAGIYAQVYSLYISNKLEKVHQYNEELTKYRFIGRPFSVVHHFFVQCLASAALGFWEDAEKGLKICKEFASKLEITPLEGIVFAFEVELALRQNDIERAVKVSAQANFNPHPPFFYFFIPQLTEVKLLFLSNEKDKALLLLEELIQIGDKSHNENLLIQALVLRAVFFQKIGDEQNSLKDLIKSLKLAENKEHIRTFLDQGKPMMELLEKIEKYELVDSQIEELENAFLKSKSPKNSSNKENLNYLSPRELEILKMVSKGYKNNKIAEELFVSIETVKRHLYNVYQKLYVNNRTSALVKARDLGFISSE